MIEVIEVDPAHREIAQLFHRRGRFQMRENGRVRLERERNEAGESTGLILQFTKLAKMIDALLERFDVAIKHGAGAAAAHVVPDAVNVEPLRGALFPPAKFVPHLRIEYLRAASGEGAESGVLKNREGLWNGTLENPLGEMAN